MALVYAPELIWQRDIMLAQEPLEVGQKMMEAAIVMNRQLQCEHGMCARRVTEAVMWIATRNADAGRLAELVDERCKLGAVESARYSLRLKAA